MNFTFTYNYTIATIMIVIYLALPATNIAHGAALDKVMSGVQTLSAMTSSVPCDDCPCSDGHGSDCCDSTFCSCECQAPLGCGLRLNYAPVIAIQNFPEPSWSLPEVYRPIFVPPQSLA
jgi:hypothetical protein